MDGMGEVGRDTDAHEVDLLGVRLRVVRCVSACVGVCKEVVCVCVCVYGPACMRIHPRSACVAA